MTPKFLQERYYYGGKLKSLSAIILDLQKIAPNQKCIDAYIIGLTYKKATASKRR